MIYGLLIISFVLIIVGAMMLTDGSVAVAQKFKVPEFIVGLTIVAVGTSMPELTVSFMSALAGKDVLGIGGGVMIKERVSIGAKYMRFNNKDVVGAEFNVIL